MPNQTTTGKAFEYALLFQSNKKLSIINKIAIVKDSSYKIAESSYNSFGEKEKVKYSKAAEAAIDHLIILEPTLYNPKNSKDILTLQIVSDSFGQKGDVRDVLFIRSLSGWEIGVSAKNNHKAVKHSRLSDSIDFGKTWLNINCSPNYFKKINPLFEELRTLKEFRWNQLESKSQRFYKPLLEAFRNELLAIDKANPGKVSSSLIKYLIGNKDFYKVIKRNKVTEILGFNLNGTLNMKSDKIKPGIKVPLLKLPKRIVEFDFKPISMDTLLLVCDEGWQISFRIHNASTMIEPSLKFDINLVGHPQSLYSNHLRWN
jgi:hypothetical protein